MAPKKYSIIGCIPDPVNRVVGSFSGTIGAAGVGITLTSASISIFIDQPWTSADREQAEDRIHRASSKADKVQIVRIEQLYPFPVKTLARHMSRFKNAKKFVWCQEEPYNMGAWNHVEPYINRTLEYIKAHSTNEIYTGRAPSASPATGFLKKHLAQQQEIVNKAITI